MKTACLIIVVVIALIKTSQVYADHKVSKDSTVVSSFDSVNTSSRILLVRPAPLDLITNLPGDWWHWSKQTFSVNQLPVIAGLTAITAVTIVTDYQTWQATAKPYDNHNKFFRTICDIGEGVGDGKSQFGLAAAYAVYGFAFNDDRAIRTASQTVEVILACGGVVQLLKHLTGRESPFLASTPTGAWRFFPNQLDYIKHVPKYDAFPSGHIATAFATLTVVMENYPEKEWIPWVGYPLMAVCATGLVGTSIHWWSDIPLGVALGYSFGRLVAHPEQFQTTNSDSAKLKTDIGISVRSDGAPELALTMKW